ncbi:hypothetical protein [Oleidesulfovibrio sp.]|uniref:VgrG-related protein n=1 Tax=Oleidesulfovibrio sp. TaxID=2909707 RepID=UPI003A84BBF8
MTPVLLTDTAGSWGNRHAESALFSRGTQPRGAGHTFVFMVLATRVWRVLMCSVRITLTFIALIVLPADVADAQTSPEGVWRQKDCRTAWMLVTAADTGKVGADAVLSTGLYDVTLYGTGECGSGASVEDVYGSSGGDISAGTGLEGLFAADLPASCEVRAVGRVTAGSYHGKSVSFTSDFGSSGIWGEDAKQVVQVTFFPDGRSACVERLLSSGCGLGVALEGDYERVSENSPPPVALRETDVMRYGAWRLRGKRSRELEEFVVSLDEPARSAFTDIELGGPEFTARWRRMEKSGGETFRTLQYRFVKNRQYDGLLEALWREKLFTVESLSEPVRDVLWSVALRHGAGTGVARNAVEAMRGRGIPMSGPEFEWFLVQSIYTERMRVGKNGRLHYYSVYPEAVRNAIDDSLKKEQDAALAALFEYQRQQKTN